MSKIFETVHAVLSRGPRPTEEIITECRRSGQTCRPETIGLFLQLSHEMVERNGVWSCKGISKNDRILQGLQKAFAAGQAYLPMDRLWQFLNEGELITSDDIASALINSGQYWVQGKLILRVR